MNEEAHHSPPIIVEFPVEAGVRAVALSPQDLANKSAQAIDNAMATIREMSRKTKEGLDQLVDRPTEVQVTFGVKLTGEAGAIISKVGAEAALQVQVTWTSDRQ
jgi:hypothetical protein